MSDEKMDNNVDALFIEPAASEPTPEKEATAEKEKPAAKEAPDTSDEGEKEAPDSSYDDEPDSPDELVIDEYGNDVAKPKTYSEEEVQKMIRERVSRGHNKQTEQAASTEQAKDGNFEYDENSDESWQKQLDTYVESAMLRVNQRQANQQWQQKELQRQGEFEGKFTSGMDKYSDFNKVVGDKPITNDMLLAIRNLDKPAAFIYAACKSHPKEIERISKIDDRYLQIAEMGKLEEKMKRVKNTSKASKPIDVKRSGSDGDKPVSRSIDELIFQDSARELKRRQGK